MFRVFIDGREGTTGLRISERLAAREDVELIALSEEKRKDAAARKWALNACDAAILCLPDAAAREAVSMLENPDTIVLDASTAHRTAPGWAYGLPELGTTAREAILSSNRVAVPGCHASGFIALVAPLVAAGLLSPETPLSCTSLTGYSGGGKKMIADYAEKGALYDPPRPYGLAQAHKHLPEMTKIAGLAQPPVFLPVVGNFYSGMLVSVPCTAPSLPRARAWRMYAPYTNRSTPGQWFPFGKPFPKAALPRRDCSRARTACSSPARAMRSASPCWPFTTTSARARPARRCNF